MNDIISEQVLAEIAQVNTLAHDWLVMYLEYVHIVDDIKDKDLTLVSQDTVVDLLEMSGKLYVHEFFHRNRDLLVVVDNLVINAWKDSDKTTDKELKHALRHSGYNMIFAVILLVLGVEKLNEYSLKIRELCHANC